MCPAVQVTVPEGVEPGGVFTLNQVPLGCSRASKRVEVGGTRHLKLLMRMAANFLCALHSMLPGKDAGTLYDWKP